MRLIEISNRHRRAIDEPRLRQAVGLVLDKAAVPEAEISIAIVDDADIWELNRRHLQHDYPTDVLSFLLDGGARFVEGEIVVSADTAQRQAAQYGWSAEDELLLYVLHGALHLVGFDDHGDDDRQNMRAAEIELLGCIDERLAEQHARHADRFPAHPPRG
jgi:probable rRNA maturation factor